MSASTSASPVETQREQPPTKRRRRRYALSCVACKARKIKCDRNVPQCSSCVARGIQRDCRWGDERDKDLSMSSSRQKMMQQQPTTTTTTTTKGVMSNDNVSSSVDEVVELVLMRLKSKDKKATDGNEIAEQVARTLDGSSDEKPLAKRKKFVSRIEMQAAANILATRAFDGVDTTASESRANIRGESTKRVVDIETVRRSLRALPPRESVDKLVEHYMVEHEPSKFNFNSVILTQQLDEFWAGVKELEVDEEQPVWPSIPVQPFMDFFPPLPDDDLVAEWERIKDAIPFLCTVLRQGLVSVVFGLIAHSLKSLDYQTIMQMQIFPFSVPEERVKRWTEQYQNLSLFHLNMSDYLEQPTLWTLQAMRLHMFFRLDLKAVNTGCVSNTVALRLAICLGLNRLGSAIDDVRANQEKKMMHHEQSGRACEQPQAGLADESKAFNVSAPSYGALITNFEEGNLALRELGRKLWTSIVSMDWLFGAHIDQIYLVNDNMNQTDPPLPLQDVEFVSEAAPALICRENLKDVVSTNAFPACFMSIARAGRLQMELENIKGSPLDYRDILRIDEGFQAAIAQLPWFLNFKSLQAEQRQQSKALPSFSMGINLQRIFVHDQVQFRLLKLHRLYIGKGFKDERYRYSLDACLNAANVIIDAKVELERLPLKSAAVVPLQIHLLQAALVLHLVLIHEVEQRQEQSKLRLKQRRKGEYILQDFDGTLAQLQLAMEFLRKDTKKSTLFSKGLSKLDAFVQMLKETQSQQTMRSPSPGRTAAADILASIPSSTMMNPPSGINSSSSSMNNFSTNATNMSFSTPSSSTSYSTGDPTISANQYNYTTAGSAAAASTSAMPASSFWNTDHANTATTSTGPSGSAMDPYLNADMWSLEALFPNSNTYSIDLVDALEKIVWAQ